MGIGGSGCSAAAAVAYEFGYKVSGCDLTDSIYTSHLEKNNVKIFSGHSPKHLEDISLLVLSPAIENLDKENPELLEAKKRGIEVLTWQEFVGTELLRDKFVISVAGTHGKSTTTALIGLILEKGGLDPTVILGAQVKEWGENFRVGKSNYFVIEADEYNSNFLNYRSNIGVITNIDFDHPEYFKDENSLNKAFADFADNFKKDSVLFRGAGVNLTNNHGKTIDIHKREFELKIPGDFNQLNASIAYQVGSYLSVEEKKILETLRNFAGVKRRFELIGEVGGIKIFDDYAHHPTALRVTLKAAREKFVKNKIWVVFQPHMFTRTYKLFSNFLTVFNEANVEKVIVTDIFPSREKDTGLVHAKDLVEKINYSVGFEKALYLSKEEAKNYLAENLENDDIVVVAGAGDIIELSKSLKTALQEKE